MSTENNILPPSVGVFAPSYWGPTPDIELPPVTANHSPEKVVRDAFSARRLNGLLRQRPLLTDKLLFDGTFNASDYPEGTVALFGVEKLKVERELSELELMALGNAQKGSAPPLDACLGRQEGLSVANIPGQTYTFGAMWGVVCSTSLEAPILNMVPASRVYIDERTGHTHIGSFEDGPTELPIGRPAGNEEIRSRIPEMRLYTPGEQYTIEPGFVGQALQSAKRALGWR